LPPLSSAVCPEMKINSLDETLTICEYLGAAWASPIGSYALFFVITSKRRKRLGKIYALKKALRCKIKRFYMIPTLERLLNYSIDAGIIFQRSEISNSLPQAALSGLCSLRLFQPS
jgi:hypothetical protein